MRIPVLVALACVACQAAPGGEPVADESTASIAWNPNLGEGRYRNPIIFADYSDPDVVRVGADYYMTASSFGNFPALPILHSRDLVNWTLIAHALPRMPDPAFDVPQHGNGVWAPAFRYHDDQYWIYWGDPDRGIYMVRARDPGGPWDAPVLVKEALGWIDPAPLWDDDGNVYLVHAFANSRAGIKSVLHVAPLSPDGTRVTGDDRLVFDGREHHPTIEGPKFFKHVGYYYIFAPAGGVATGWQTVLRAENVYGPYEDRIVLAQGDTDINGPHQGAWVRTESGQDWFVHFQDRDSYGRIVHLQPMTWRDGWPVIGSDPDGDGTGEPVLEHAMPDVAIASSFTVPQTTDEFDSIQLGLQWQWQANPRDEWYSLTARPGWMRLHAQPLPDGAPNLWPVPSLLLQKLPAPVFTATTQISHDDLAPGESAGLIVMGLDYAYIAVRRTRDGVELVEMRTQDADQGTPEQGSVTPVDDGPLHLRVTMSDGAICQFAWSTDGNSFTAVGAPFAAREGRWIGAKVGLFAIGAGHGFADFDFLRIEP